MFQVRFIVVLFVLVLAVGLLGGCAAKKVERIDTEQVRDLSGLWNDTDSRLVSEEMIKDALSRQWLPQFQQAKNQMPSVIVGSVTNRSHEHINVATFVNDMERELINSGRVTFVASKDERQEIREERAEQDLHASEKSRKPMGEELGADFMLKGSINTIIDTEGKEEVRFYQIDLTLISMSDNRKVWVGQKKIKKYITRRKVRP